MRSKFAQCLAHQTGLQTGEAVAHFTFEFGLGGQGRHRVHHDQIHRAGAHEAVHNFKRLLTGVGLADQQVLQVDTQVLGVLNVKRMLGIHKCTLPANFLHFGDHLQR